MVHVFRNAMLNFDRLVVLVVSDHVASRLFNVLDLVKLYQQYIIHFLEILLHFVLGHSKRDLTLKIDLARMGPKIDLASGTMWTSELTDLGAVALADLGGYGPRCFGATVALLCGLALRTLW